jgi:hypothetical protein
MPKSFWHSENIFTLQKIQKLEKQLPNNFRQIMKVIFFSSLPTIPGALHMKINMLGRTTLGKMSCTLKTNVPHP